MRNAECTVYIGTKRGLTWTYRRDKDRWAQTGPTGKIHRLTAEQLLSHILPPLAGRSPAVVRVEPDRPKKKRKWPVSSGESRDEGSCMPMQPSPDDG